MDVHAKRPIKVVKFGGTSLANADNIRACKDIVMADNQRSFIVVSAPGKCAEHHHKMTDLLIDAHTKMCFQDEKKTIDDVLQRFGFIARELGVDISKELARTREEIEINRCDRDFVISRGEYIMALLFAKYCGYTFLDAAEYIVIKKSGECSIEKTKQKFAKLCRGGNYVMGGFFGRGECCGVKTFDRGGSDYTGAVVAVCLASAVYEIFTDTNGVQTANPAIVKHTRTIKEIDYGCLHKLCRAGASVIYPNCVPLLKNHNVPLLVCNTFDPGGGRTIVTNQKPGAPYFSITYSTGANINKDTTDILFVTNHKVPTVGDLNNIFKDTEVYMTNITNTEIRLLTGVANTTRVVNLLHKAVVHNI